MGIAPSYRLVWARPHGGWETLLGWSDGQEFRPCIIIGEVLLAIGDVTLYPISEFEITRHKVVPLEM